MPRYVALLRGVSPMNAKMAELKKCFEAAGFANVRTVLASGNVVFDAPARSETALARAIEAGMARSLDRTFATIVRRTDHLLGLLAADPYSAFKLSPKAKKIVTFLRDPHAGKLALPFESKPDRAQILAMLGNEVFSAYLPNPRGPVFMALLEKTFGKGITTRTWDTVRKCANA